jgi:cysteinyl-tRNA synthetase
MRIFNTLTRKKEDFVPLKAGEVGMYVCGVTVYDLSHVGHARSSIVFDVIRRYLTFKGLHVRFVKNYTDVDDRIIRKANEAGVSSREISERYVAEFDRDMAALRVLPPDVAPKATEHIPQMVELIERLIAAGHAYVIDGDVYFEISTFPAYGRLSGKNLDELLAGARVDVDERKRDPRDFALWKAAKPGEPQWASPWGPGRPGWHIECSAMSMEYLGESFDIHGGGEDLIFPHHECEIAQSEAVTRRPLSRYWAHNAFVNMNTEKMSKSLGNTLWIRDVVKRHSADAIRLWVVGTHYRNPIEYGEERLRESESALQTLWSPVEQARKLAGSESSGAAARELAPEFAVYRQRFIDAMDDDFNTPQALGVLYEFGRELNRGGGHGVEAIVRGTRELSTLIQALGFAEPARDEVSADLRARVDTLIHERAAARQRRDWKRADEIRAEVDALGVVLEDSPAGTIWRRKA